MALVSELQLKVYPEETEAVNLRSQDRISYPADSGCSKGWHVVCKSKVCGNENGRLYVYTVVDIVIDKCLRFSEIE